MDYGSDTVSVFSSSSATFLEEDFQLPDLDLSIAGNLDAVRAEESSKRRINKLKNEITYEKKLHKKLDHRLPKIPDSYFCNSKGIKVRPEKVSLMRSTMNAKAQLELMKHSLRRKPGEPKEDLDILQSIAEGTFQGDEDEYAESTLDHPKLGSNEEKLEDFRQSGIEYWCAKRGKVPHQTYTNEQKRMLRKWFRALDTDGSGEVNVEELQDPLLSSGILKTREQVVRVLANVDKNNTMGIDFEEFLMALGANKFADETKLKKLQQMSADPFFETDTLLTSERRKKLIKSILRRCEERQQQIDRLYKKYDKQKLSKKEREVFELERERLEEEQSRSIYLHLKYIHSLELVIEDRQQFLEIQDAEKLEENNSKNRFTNYSDFYHSISDIRLNSSNRYEAITRLSALVPLETPNSSTVFDPNQSKYSMPSLFGGSSQASDPHHHQSKNDSLVTPMIGSMYLDSLKPVKKNSVEDLRGNPYKIYAPYSPEIKKIKKSDLKKFPKD
jgi:hypothetical protein